MSWLVSYVKRPTVLAIAISSVVILIVVAPTIAQWYPPCAQPNWPVGKITMWQHSFKGNSVDIFAGPAACQAGVLHSLRGSAVHDQMTSLTWNLPGHVIVVFYEHPNGTGRQFVIWRSGSVTHLNAHGFNDCVSAWAWFQV